MKTRFDRKVKNGKVKINGKFYTPSDQWKKYDGCFENTVQTFIIYRNNDRFIHHCNTPADAEGYYNWYFWNKVDVLDAFRNDNKKANIPCIECGELKIHSILCENNITPE